MGLAILMIGPDHKHKMMANPPVANSHYAPVRQLVCAMRVYLTDQ